MAEPLLEVENVVRTYLVGDVEVRALRGVSLGVEAGEFVAIMGASGSGKSTLMSILGCLDRPSSGRVLLSGVDVTLLDEVELARIRSERIGFVFQSFNLLPRTSALENVGLPLYYVAGRSAHAAARQERARAALRAAGLEDRAAATVKNLSHGEQRQLEIALALAAEPRLLLLDEPTAGLSPGESQLMADLVRRLDPAMTVLIIEHDMDIALEIAERVTVLHYGRVVADGPRDDVKADPLVREIYLGA